MKKALIVIFILKSSLTFTQNFNDRIVTLTGDTIKCQILLVNKVNILYNKKVKKHFQSEYISLTQVKDRIIDKKSKSELLRKNGDSLTYSISIDSTYQTSSLVAKRTHLHKGREDTSKVTFETGTFVYIKTYSNNTLIKGEIENITDSSVVINGKSIILKDISSISKNRGGDVLIVGLSILGLVPIGLLAGPIFYPEQLDVYGNNANGNNILSYVGWVLFVGVIDLITIVPAGIIKLVLTRHYKMDEGWKLSTTNKKIK